MFGLSSDNQMSVDGMYAGNPARFINHAPQKRANVEVSSKLIYDDDDISPIIPKLPDGYSNSYSFFGG